MVKTDLILYYLTAILIVASIIDVRSFRIPNWLTYPTMAAGISYFSITNSSHGLLFSLGGAATGFGLLLIPYLMGGTGAGDVKLLGAVGSFLGSRGACTVFMISSILGGVYALFLLSRKGLLMQTFKRYGSMLRTFMYAGQLVYVKPGNEEKQIKVSYGLAIALGTGLYLAFGTI